jgi:hypothetical protein
VHLERSAVGALGVHGVRGGEPGELVGLESLSPRSFLVLGALVDVT